MFLGLVLQKTKARKDKGLMKKLKKLAMRQGHVCLPQEMF